MDQEIDKSRDKDQEIMHRRLAISAAYCRAKGWKFDIEDLSDLSIDQILEIRNTPEWKDVPRLVEEGR